MDSENGSFRRSNSSPERVRGFTQKSKVVGRAHVRRRTQVVYYLTRNGQLEHPHFLELSLLPNQHLRLRDVMDRLTALRGKGMPSLYSWSSKRTYKNGYVWNDLLENDIIFPTDGGAEYVLKGSEIIEGSAPTSDTFRQLHVVHSNTKQVLPSARPRLDDEYEEEEEKRSYTSSTTPRSRCSRGVSTEELEETRKSIAELTMGHESDSPPPLSSTSSNPSGGLGGGGEPKKDLGGSGRVPRPLPPREPSELGPSRNSVLLQLIACGATTSVTKAKKNGMHKEVMCRNMGMKMEEEIEDKDMIRYMSENPRFGNFQSEEKEYFSGSIVESMSSDQCGVPEPSLKRSNSYHDQQERSLKIGSAEEAAEEEKRDKAVQGKCIPRIKSSCASRRT